jgi:iron-sulfur cluster repair protein YtfE (RIC family)
VVDPLRELAHDHRELTGLLVAVHEALSRVERGVSKLEDELHEIGDGVEAFREALLEHFAREQEGLLPFVLKHVPAAGARVDAIILEHDRIGEALTLLVNELSGDVGPAAALGKWRATLARFEELYGTHTKSELAFFQEISASLAADPAATEQLRTLLRET